MKDTYPSFSLSLVIFVTIAYATNTITMDTSVLLLIGLQEIKLAMKSVDPFLKFPEVKTKCHNNTKRDKRRVMDISKTVFLY